VLRLEEYGLIVERPETPQETSLTMCPGASQDVKRYSAHIIVHNSMLIIMNKGNNNIDKKNTNRNKNKNSKYTNHNKIILIRLYNY